MSIIRIMEIRRWIKKKMVENNGNSNINSSNGGIIDINEYLKQQGYIVSRRPDTTGLVGGMPADAVKSSDFFEDLNKQTLASLF